MNIDHQESLEASSRRLRVMLDDALEVNALLRNKNERLLMAEREALGRVTELEAQVRERIKAAAYYKDECDRLRDELDHLKSEFGYESWRGDHLVYEREWEAFDRWQRGEGDRLARRVTELEAALRKIGCLNEHWCPGSDVFMDIDPDDPRPLLERWLLCRRCAALAGGGDAS